MGLAEQGIANLLMHVDSLIVIPNERLKMISQEKITLMNAFQAADNVLRQGVESISALINVPAFINLDFADVRSIMKDAGYAHMGVGSAKGAGKAENAAKAAISSRCWRPASPAHTASSSTSLPAPTSVWRMSRLPPASSPRAHIPMRTSSGVLPSTRTSPMRCASPSWLPASTTRPLTACAAPGTAAAGTAPGVTASAPSAVFSAEVNTPPPLPAVSAAKPVEEENSDTSYYDDLLAILNKRR